VRAVIADTGPIHYLVLIGHSEILPALFEKSLFLPSCAMSWHEWKRRMWCATGYELRRRGWMFRDRGWKRFALLC